MTQLLRHRTAPFLGEQFKYLDFGAPIVGAESIQASEEGRALVLKYVEERAAKQKEWLEQEKKLQTEGGEAALKAARARRLSDAFKTCVGSICPFLSRGLGGGRAARKTQRRRGRRN